MNAPTATPEPCPEAAGDQAGAPLLDVIIVGAGITGLGMAAHLAAKCPQRRFTILERRARLGGTWDLFRYPGIRSDSDMYTLGYEFEPWRGDHSIASGAAILEYLNHVADTRGLRDHIRFGQGVISADWDSTAGVWRLVLEDGAGVRTALAGRFLFLGSGYYDYENPHDAQISGLECFGGETIHPQFWPDAFDPAGKRIVVIGSGATAVTLLPSLAEKAAHVTMLQRTPTWLGEMPSRDRIARFLRRWLPERWAYRLVRWKNWRMQDMLFRRARSQPEKFGRILLGHAARRLRDRFDPQDYTPPYGPWEQRLCLVPDGDLFRAIRSGKAGVVTARIAGVEPDGVRLDDGRLLEADVIVTATGLRMALGGGIAISRDGVPVNLGEHWFYRSVMLSNLPNLAAPVGYLNASWTLRIDLVADWLTRLFNHMDAWGRAIVTPVLPAGHGLEEEPTLEMFSSGYLRRARGRVPKSSPCWPWRFGMDYRQERAELAHAPIDDGVLAFARAPVAAPPRMT